MEAWLALAGVGISAICTIIVALVNVNGARNREAEKVQKQAEQEARDRREKEIDQKLQALSDTLGKIDGRIDQLEGEMAKQRETDAKLMDDLRELAERHQVTAEYVHNVSTLITVLAEGMRDQHLDGNITNAIAVYRKFESDVLNRLMTKPVVED